MQKMQEQFSAKFCHRYQSFKKAPIGAFFTGVRKYLQDDIETGSFKIGSYTAGRFFELY
jgi:hypothetical protein